MKITFYTALILLFISQIGFSQNIVPNGDFENYTSLPSALGQWGNCVGWGNASGGGSPDYCHVLGSFSAALPNNFFASVMPFSGLAIMGFAGMGPLGNNYREYPSIQLSSAMVIGNTYNVSFHITSGAADHYYGYSCNRLGVRFSTGPLTQVAGSPIGGIPQLEITGQVWSTSWLAVNFNFTADSTYNQITIGNFYNDDSTSYMSQIQVNSSSVAAYYFIDDVSVIEDPSASVNNLVLGKDLTVYPNPTSGNFSIDLVETYNATTITITDLNGKLIQSKTYNKCQFLNMKLEQPAGIYLLNIETESKKAIIKLIKE
jgi:hypothetical protein